MGTHEHERPARGPAHAVTDDSALSPAEQARSLVAGASLAALGVLTDDGPFVSHVVPVAEPEGTVLLLLSGLAEHTRALGVDARASLLFVQAAAPDDDASALARVTLVGRCVAVTDAERTDCTARYVATRPRAAHVATFADFRPYRFEPSSRGVRWIGGFGRAEWLDAADYRDAPVDPIAAVRVEALLVVETHRAALLRGVTAKLTALDGTPPGPDTVQSARVLAVDGRGIDVLVRDPTPRALRLAFAARLHGVAGIGAALNALD